MTIKFKIECHIYKKVYKYDARAWYFNIMYKLMHIVSIVIQVSHMNCIYAVACARLVESLNIGTY